LLKNALYNTAAGIVRIAIGLLTIPVLIRTLGIEEYGLWTLAMTTISIVTLAEAGLSLATTMFAAQDLERKDVEGLSQTLTIAVGAMLVLSLSAAVCLWLLAPPIVGSFTKLQPSQQVVAVRALQLGAVVVWARLLQQVMVGIEQAYQRYDLSNLVNTLQSFALNLGMLAVALSGGKTVELMEWQIWIAVVSLVAHCCLSWFLLQGFGVSWRWSQRRGLEIFRYSLTIWLSAIGGVMFSQIDKVIVGAVLGTSQLGIYAAVTNITNQINVLSSLPVQPMIPALSALAARDEFEPIEVEERVKQAFILNSLFALGIGNVLLIVAPFLLKLLLGYTPNSDIILGFRVVILIYALFSLNAVGCYLCISLNAARTCTIVQIVSGLVALALIWLGASQFGLLGAMFGNIGFMMTWLMNIHGLKIIKIQKRKWLQWLLVPLLITGSIFIISTIDLNNLAIELPIIILLTTGFLCWYVFQQMSIVKSIYARFNCNPPLN
jgi:O-antigen/teichoic acid export membrane protein